MDLSTTHLYPSSCLHDLGRHVQEPQELPHDGWVIVATRCFDGRRLRRYEVEAVFRVHQGETVALRPTDEPAPREPAKVLRIGDRSCYRPRARLPVVLYCDRLGLPDTQASWARASRWPSPA